MPHVVVLHPRALGGEDHGVMAQHVTALTELLGLRGWEVTATDALHPDLPALVGGADVVVVQMLAEPEVESIVRSRRAVGRPTVFEITGSFLAVLSRPRDSHPLRSPLLRQHLLHHASLCDALQVDARGLADVFGAVNGRIVAFEPYVPIPERVAPKPGGFVVGWGGTRSHSAELASIAPAVASFCARHPDVTFAFMGDRGLFDEHFARLPPSQAVVRPFGAHGEYLDFVSGLHVGLGPAGPSAVNAARTDTKFATYAAHGAAAVLQDGPVYGPHRDRARLFRTPEELEAALEELHADPGERDALAARAREWVVAERRADVLAAQRADAYAALMGDAAPAPQGPSSAAGDPAAHARLRAAAGLEPAEALPAARAIVADRPGYEQAQLLLVRSLERLGRHDEALRHADGLEPSAIYADAFLEVQARCARRARPERVEALRMRIASGYRRARLARGESVLARSRSILRHQPYDHSALRSTIELMRRRDPDAPELDGLYRRAALVCPEDVPPERRPAALEPFLPA